MSKRQIRIATKNDIQELKHIWYDAFLEHDGKESIDYYFEHSLDLDHTFILEEDKDIKSILSLNQHVLNFDGVDTPVSFVVGVATPKQYQRQGYMKELLEYAIDYAKNTLNQKIMILQAYDWAIYRPFGFVDTYYKSKFTLDHNFFVTYEVKELDAITSDKLLDIYNNYTKDLNGYKVRDKAYFDNMIEANKANMLHYAIYQDSYILFTTKFAKVTILEAAFIDVSELFTLINTVKVKCWILDVELSSDIYNFDYYRFTKELYMMTLKLDESFEIKNEKLYISEVE